MPNTAQSIVVFDAVTNNSNSYLYQDNLQIIQYIIYKVGIDTRVKKTFTASKFFV